MLARRRAQRGKPVGVEALEQTAHGLRRRVEREPGPGRQVRYRLDLDALGPAASWLRTTQADWDARLGRLAKAVKDR